MKKLFVLACALVIATSTFAFAAQGKPKSVFRHRRKVRRRNQDTDRQAEGQAGRVRDYRRSEVLDNKAKSDATAFAAGHKVTSSS